MSATFNAQPLPTQLGRQHTTRPAVASAGGTAPSSGVAASDAMNAHEAKPDPHPQYETTAEVAAQIEAHRTATDPHADRAYADALMATHNSTAGVHQIADVATLQDELDLAPFESTGSVTGFALSVFSATQVTIAPGTAIFTSWASPAAPAAAKVVYAGANVTITGIGGSFITYLAINSAGAILQQSTPYTAVQRRTLVPLGAVVHTNLVSISSAVSKVPSLQGTGNQLHDLLDAIGTLNVSGNVYSAGGANLTLQRTAGTIFKFGANPDYLDPHNLTIAASAPGFSFLYHTSTGVIAGPTTTVNVTQYESAPGVLSTVPNNRFSIQRIYLFQTGVTRIQYGTAVYLTIADATAALATEVFTTEPNTATEGVLRGYLIVEKNATNLQNTAQASFIPVGKFLAPATGSTALTAANIIAALGYTPESTTALPAHVAAADPHGDRAYAVSQDAAHVAAADPHTQYMLELNPVATGTLALTSATAATLTVTKTGGGGAISVSAGSSGGADVTLNPAPGVGCNFQSSSEGVGSVNMLVASNTASTSALFLGRRQRGDLTTAAAVQADDSITNFQARAHDGTAMSGAQAQVVMRAGSNWTTGDHACYFEFVHTPAGTTSTESLLILRNSAIRAVVAGLEATPVYTWDNDPDTGMWRPGANTLAWSTNAVERLRITTTAIQGALPWRGGAGTASSPTFGFTATSGAGMYITSGGELALSFGSAPKMLVNASGVSYGSTPASVPLHVRGAGPVARIQDSNTGATAYSQTHPGLDLLANGMSPTAKLTPAINFGSTDADFTTTNPKFGAALMGEATESYNADTAGGMDLVVYATPTAPGAGGGAVESLRVRSTGTAIPGTLSTGGNIRVNALGTPPAIATNGDMTFTLTSNTNLRISVRGSDGVTRVANLTLA